MAPDPETGRQTQRMTPMVARMIALLGFADILAGVYVLNLAEDAGSTAYEWAGWGLIITGALLAAGFLWLAVTQAKRARDDG